MPCATAACYATSADQSRARRETILFLHGSLDIRTDMLGAVGKVALDWEASFAFAPSRESLDGLGSRTLLLRGDRSPPGMLELVDTLHALMPGSTRCVIASANHLLPMTRATDVTQAIRLHLHVGNE